MIALVEQTKSVVSTYCVWDLFCKHHITVFTLKMPVSAAVLQVCLAECDGARAV